MSIDLTLQAIEQMAAELEATAFEYEALEHPSCVVALVVNGEPAQTASAGDAVQLVLDSTPFYGEGGGQVGDRGSLSGQDLIVSIESVNRQRDVFVHAGSIERGQLSVGDLMTAQVDAPAGARPRPITPPPLAARPSTGGGFRISQAGWWFRSLAFRFPLPRAVTAAELEQLEALINGWIAEAHSLEVQEMAIEAAKAAGAVAMFGEKYADVVRGGCTGCLDGALRRYPCGQHR